MVMPFPILWSWAEILGMVLLDFVLLCLHKVAIALFSLMSIVFATFWGGRQCISTSSHSNGELWCQWGRQSEPVQSGCLFIQPWCDHGAVLCPVLSSPHENTEAVPLRRVTKIPRWAYDGQIESESTDTFQSEKDKAKGRPDSCF